MWVFLFGAMGKKRGPKGPSKPMSDKEYGQLIGMIRIQCTRDEIIGILGVSKCTLKRRLNERGFPNFDTLFKKHQHEGKASLRRMQWKSAEKGNPALQIWLGKQVLGQSERMISGDDTPQKMNVNVERKSGRK